MGARHGGRLWVVAQRHPRASDEGPGTARRPFRTVNRAADLAQPGDTVLVRAGVYRERVAPARGGEPGRPIVYRAAPGEDVFLRGSEPLDGPWRPWRGSARVFRAPLAALPRGAAAYGGRVDAALYGDFDPYRLHFNRARAARPQEAVVARLREQLDEARGKLRETAAGADLAFGRAQRRVADLEVELASRTRKANRRHLPTLGQVFVRGVPLLEAETLEELDAVEGTWMVDAAGAEVLVHAQAGARPAAGEVELSVRHTVFAPLVRGLGHLHVAGFTIEHAANHFPTWGEQGWPQAGALSTRSGHDWLIEGNTVRFAKGLGIDCGSEGGGVHIERRGADDYAEQHRRDRFDTGGVGGHTIRGNRICDNGHCGLAGIRHRGTQVLGNVIERNNRWSMSCDRALREVRCARVPGADRDWNGRRPGPRPLPGPFQDLAVGPNRRNLRREGWGDGAGAARADG